MDLWGTGHFELLSFISPLASPPEKDMPLFVTSRRTTLGFEVLGPAPLQHARATSKVVFYIHGLAGNRFEYAVCDQLGPTGETTPPEACVISVDRPGHGDSSLWRGEDSIRGANGGSTSPYLSLAHDLLELADHLGVERYSLLAWSSGGPFALACSLVHPRSRLVKTMTVAGDPPWNKVPWRDINALQRLCWFIYSTRDVPGLAPALGRVVAGLFNGLGLMLGLAVSLHSSPLLSCPLLYCLCPQLTRSHTFLSPRRWFLQFCRHALQRHTSATHQDRGSLQTSWSRGETGDSRWQRSRRGAGTRI